MITKKNPAEQAAITRGRLTMERVRLALAEVELAKADARCDMYAETRALIEIATATGAIKHLHKQLVDIAVKSVPTFAPACNAIKFTA